MQVADADVVLVALFTVVGSDVAVEGVAHVGGRRGQVEAMFGQLLPVEADVQLRHILGTADVDLRASLHLAHPIGQLGRHPVGGGEIVAVELNIHRVLTAHTATAHRDVVLVQFLIFVEVGTYLVGNFCDGTFTLGLVFETHVEFHDVGARLRHDAEGVVIVGLSYREVAHQQFGVLFLHVLSKAETEVAGFLHAGADGQFHCGRQSSHILSGEELRRDDLQQGQAAAKDGKGNQDDDEAV